MALEPFRFEEENARSEDPIALAAARWITRRDRGLTHNEEMEWRQWLAANPRHAKEYAELQQMWGVLDRLPAVEMETASPATLRRGRGLWAAVALAAAAVVAVGGWLSLGTSSGRFVTEARTGGDGWHHLDLPDGHHLQLNADSAVTVNYTARERRVSLLHGEASFSVAKDAARPFVVRAGDVGVVAIGTSFDVRIETDKIDVLVVSGRVRVEDIRTGSSLLAAPEVSASATAEGKPKAEPATTPLLAAGQRVIVAKARADERVKTAATTVAREDLARMQAWRHRRLKFDEMPLADLVKEFNRYNSHRLVITDRRLGEYRFEGNFLAGDHATLVRLLEQHFGVRVEKEAAETRLSLP